MYDDRQTHWVTGTTHSFRIFPLHVHFVLTDMPTKAEWSNGHVDSRVVVDISGWHNRSVERLAHEHGRRLIDNSTWGSAALAIMDRALTKAISPKRWPLFNKDRYQS
ncbi:hypothetical protein RB195_010517 [Necator americanus]|uniref:Uncharacterized protein n=1 Tax=Necator americanus TaxID=51031 RepID=A0ABR1CYD4_NECAM